MAEKSKPVTIDDLAEANIERPKSDKSAKDEAVFFAHKESMQKAELGLVGSVWGSNSEKPGNIAAIVAIVLLVFVGVLLFQYNEWEKFSDTLAVMMSTITLILGYLFGSSSKD